MRGIKADASSLLDSCWILGEFLGSRWAAGSRRSVATASLRVADELVAAELKGDFALVFPIFGAPAAVSGATAGRLVEQDHPSAFPVEHRRLRIELVVELCGQWPGIRGAVVGNDGWGDGGGISDCQFDQSRLVGLQDAGLGVDEASAAIADRREGALRGGEGVLNTGCLVDERRDTPTGTEIRRLRPVRWLSRPMRCRWPVALWHRVFP